MCNLGVERSLGVGGLAVMRLMEGGEMGREGRVEEEEGMEEVRRGVVDLVGAAGLGCKCEREEEVVVEEEREEGEEEEVEGGKACGAAAAD